MRNIVPTITAISVGVLVLLGYILPFDEAILVRGVLTDWAVIVAALAMVLGVFNLALTNWSRVRNQEKGWFYNLVTILSLLGFFILDQFTGPGGANALYSSDSLISPIFTGIIIATQASLAALGVVFLITSASQLLKNNRDIWTFLFLGMVVFILLTWVPISQMKQFAGLRNWVISIPISAGLRGMLIGMSLGTVFFGLRILIGNDRLYKKED